MRIGADHRVRIGLAHVVLLRVKYHAAQVLEVHLVDDARVRRHHPEVLESALAPAQERVALTVAVELDLVVKIERIGAAIAVDLHRMVNHQLRGRQWIDAVGIATQLDDGIAHCGQIDDSRHAGEILQDDAAWRERDFGARHGFRIPVGERQDVVPGDVAAVFEAQQVLEQDLERVGETVYMAFLDGAEPIDLILLAADIKGETSAEAVRHDCSLRDSGIEGRAGPSGAAL